MKNAEDQQLVPREQEVLGRRCTSSDQHGSFDLLRFRPGPVRRSLGNLAVLRSREVTILMPNLVRTPNHSLIYGT